MIKGKNKKNHRGRKTFGIRFIGLY